MKFSFKKFIRAEYPSRQSLWIPVGLIALALILLAIILNLYFYSNSTLAATWFSFISPWIYTIGLIPVLLMLWNSAHKAFDQGGSNTQMVIKRIIIVNLAFYLSYGAYTYFVGVVPLAVEVFNGLPKFSKHKLVVSENKKTLIVFGYIGLGFAKQIENALDQNPNISFISLASPGGLDLEGRKIAQLVKKRHLVTLVIRQCSSACIDIFLAGSRRYITESAKLGFHSIGVSEYFPELFNKLLFFRARSGYKSRLLSYGLSDGFVSKVMNIPPSDIWYPTIEELQSEAIFTNILPANKHDASKTEYFDFK